MNYNKISLNKHKKTRGKLEIKSKFPLKNQKDLSIAYTPGIGEVSRQIAKDKKSVYEYTIKGNTIAVVTDGSAVLGLGNIGPEAALPVMEGKALLFKEFAGVDAWPICLDTQDTEEIIETIKRIAPGFGGINLEDISAPRCFEIEARLKKELPIPIFHDDQHGTAIVALAALLNALKVTNKKIKNIKVVINGAGAGAIAVAKLFIKAGVPAKKMIILDRVGILVSSRKDLPPHKEEMAQKTNRDKVTGDLYDALLEADVFIGLSSKDVLTKEMVVRMNKSRIVFAMANPDPEISLKEALKSKITVFGTGRSDYPNQINNVLVFPGIFRGALDARVRNITDEMKLSAARALSGLVSTKELSSKYILPSPFNKKVAVAVAEAVKKASKKK